MDRSRLGLLLSTLMSYFLSMAMLYQMSPFFQVYAEEHAGASDSIVGLIYAMLPLGAFICSFPSVHLVARIGAKSALASGLLLLAASSLGFGLSETVPFWFLYRSIQGFATAPIYTSISTLLADTFTEEGEFSKVNGYMEAVANIGLAVGPLLGGALFQFGGFRTPFIVSAAAHVLFVGLTGCGGRRARSPQLLSEASAQNIENAEMGNNASESTDSARQVGMQGVLYAPVLWMAAAGALSPMLGGALEPVLAKHFIDCLGEDVSSSTVGLLIATQAMTSTIGAILVSRFRASDYVVALGFALLALIVAALGATNPSAPYFLGLERGSLVQWILQVVLGFSLGIGYAITWTPVLPKMLNEAALGVARTHGIAESAAATAVSTPVAGLFNAAVAVGEFFGPTLGGALISLLGFGPALLFIAIGLLLFATALGVAHCLRIRASGTLQMAEQDLSPSSVPQQTNAPQQKLGAAVRLLSWDSDLRAAAVHFEPKSKDTAASKQRARAVTDPS